jgi:large conductance mechanosensitive channel
MRGLVVALAFSNLVKAFTDNIINPLIAAVQPGNLGPGLGWQLVKGGGDGTFLNLGGFISAIIYFIVFMTVVYFLIVLPYKAVIGSRMGKVVFGDPPPTKICPACLSDDLNPAATRCKPRLGYWPRCRLTARPDLPTPHAVSVGKSLKLVPTV